MDVKTGGLLEDDQMGRKRSHAMHTCAYSGVGKEDGTEMVPGLHLILQVEVGNVLALKAGRCHRIQLRLVAISEEATSVAVEFLGLMESQRKAEHCPYVGSEYLKAGKGPRENIQPVKTLVYCRC